jgi:hypothetical protein
MVFEIHDHIHWLERLTAEMSRTVIITTSTLGTAQAIKELLPAEIFKVTRSKVQILVLFIHLEIRFAKRAFGIERHKEDVERRREDVAVLTPRYIVRKEE